MGFRSPWSSAAATHKRIRDRVNQPDALSRFHHDRIAVCVQFRLLPFPVRASAPGSRRIAARSQNDACPCFVVVLE